MVPMAETALNAIGLTAFPLTPPYVVRFSNPTAGHACPLELSPIKPDTVLIAVTPSAPPCYDIKIIYLLSRDTFADNKIICKNRKILHISFRVYLCSSGNVDNIRNVWRELGKKWNGSHFPNPGTNVSNHVVILATCQPHPSLA